MRSDVMLMLLGCLAVGAAGCDDGRGGDPLTDQALAADVGPDRALDEGPPVDAGDASSPIDAAPMDAGRPDAQVDVDAASPDMGPIIEPESSPLFLAYARPGVIPGRFPASPCDAIDAHHVCVATAGCGWLRTIKDDGICRADPISRCLEAGECACRAHDFHGDAAHDADLEIFLPLSVVARNLAPRTSAFGGAAPRYAVAIDMDPVLDESREHFTSRTDFTAKRLHVDALDPAAMNAADLANTQGLSVTLKFMQVWDRQPAAMSGILFDGLGMQVRVEDDQMRLETADGAVFPIAGEHPATGGAKDYQCNQLAIVVPAVGDARVWAGGVETVIPGLDMAAVRAALAARAPRILSVGPANAKIWDLRIYGNGRQLTPDQIAEIGKRCGGAGDYPIPAGYPRSNERYSYGMGGTRVVPHHTDGAFSSGVYVTLRIPEGEAFPYMAAAEREALNRMIGFWDRWHEQMNFEMDFAPYVDLRALPPEGALNSHRNYPAPMCEGDDCGEWANYANPCRFTTDLFQAFNWLPEDWPGEPTSADHRRIASRGGYGRWDTADRPTYQSWTRPVHEHGHTAHFTLMRTYEREHHYVRGIAGESFAEVMVQYVLAGTAPWMLQGLSYYPSVPLALEGRWDGERHVLKSPQPYQSGNIGDRGLGSRFYGAGLWWTFVAHFAGKPYLVGRLAGDSDLLTGTTLQKARFYLAQEGLDLGDLFGNFAAHTATWDWPRIGHFLYDVEQDPFQGIETWCTENSGPDCTIDGLKIHADVSPETGTDGAWVEGPADRQPGGFASNTIRMASAPGGALYAISLDFDVPPVLFPDTGYHIGLRSTCRDDPRFFSSRIVVAEAGSVGQAERPRPQYYKIPGRHVDEVIIRVPEGAEANVYLMPIPTPPFELEDVAPFVESHSLTWPYRYRITRLDAVPAGAEVATPTVLAGDEVLELARQEGRGFVFDCFDRARVRE